MTCFPIGCQLLALACMGATAASFGDMCTTRNLSKKSTTADQCLLPFTAAPGALKRCSSIAFRVRKSNLPNSARIGKESYFSLRVMATLMTILLLGSFLISGAESQVCFPHFSDNIPGCW